MLEVGFRKTSLVDYPGKVAAVLFFPGCNLRCPYCHNGGLVSAAARGDGLVPIAEALSTVRARKGKIEAVVLSGGEPLLREELPAIASYLRREGFFVKLDTNGLLPAALEGIEADYYAIDVKSSPERYEALGWAGGDPWPLLGRSLDFVRASGKPYEVRIVSMPHFFDLRSSEAIADLLDPRDPVKIAQFRNEVTLEAWCGRIEPYTKEAALGHAKGILERVESYELRGF